MYQKCLFATSTAETVNQGSEASKKPGETNSGEEDKSGESHQSSDSGKSVRGGVRIYNSIMDVELNSLNSENWWPLVPDDIDLFAASLLVEFSFAGSYWSRNCLLLRQGKETTY